MNLLKLRRTAAGFLVVLMLFMQLPYNAAALENPEPETAESVVTLPATEDAEAATEPETVTEDAEAAAAPEDVTEDAEAATEPEDVTEDAEAATEPETVTEDAETAAEPENMDGVSANLSDGEDATPATESVYAILYEDGTMVFQVGNTPEDGRTVTATYPVDMTTGYEHIDFWTSNTPWYDQRDLITRVDFKDKIAPTVMTAWFQNCSNLTEIENLSNLDFSNLTSIRAIFFGCRSLKAVDVSGWDISGMDDIHGAFFGCSSLTELNVSAWDVSHVKDMGGIFGGTTLPTIDVARWDTSSVEDMHGAFANCSALTEVDVSAWNTSNVKKFYSLFINCSNLTELDLSGWDTSKGDAFEQMFSGCSSLTTIRASEKFVTSGVTEDAHRADMFTGCAALVGGNGTAYSAEHTDYTYARVDTANAPGYLTIGVFAILYNDGIMVFQYGDTPEAGRAVTATYPVSMAAEYGQVDDPVTRHVPTTPWYEHHSMITQVDIKDKISPRHLSHWFMDLENLTEITHLENLDISRVINMFSVFFRCASLKTLDVGGWNTSSVENMHALFYNCSALTELNVSLWDVSHVKDMAGMFSGTTLKTVDVGRWDTSGAEDMHAVFFNCPALTHVDVSGWDTSNVEHFELLFMRCPELTELDLSGWDTSKGTSFDKMFYESAKLTTIRASDKFVTSGVTEDAHRADMFTGCAALVGGNGTAYDAERTDDTYARIDAAGAPGYFTLGVFAILYNDGTMVFQNGDTPEAGRAVIATYPVNMSSSYFFKKAIPNTPWYNNRELVTKVDFADKIAPQSLAYWFMYLPNLAEFTNFSNLDISHATSIRNAFYGCESLTALDLSGWDTSVCTDFHGAFAHCKKLANVGPFQWKTSNVTDMSGIFSDNAFLTELDLSSWDTSKVTDTSTLFSSCSNLRSLNLSGWDVSNVTDIHAMFVNCSSLTELDLSSFDTSAATNMAYLFNGCANLKTIFVSERFVASSAVSDSMFMGCAALVGGAGTKYDAERTDNAYARIDAAGAPGYFTMGVFAILYDDGTMVFQNGDMPEAGRTVIATYPVSLNTEYGRQTGLTIEEHIPYTPWYENEARITRVDFKDKISPTYIAAWFMCLEHLTEITNFDNLDISKVVNMSGAFFDCKGLTELDVSKWDTSNVQNMHALFSHCSGLKELAVSDWDTTSLTDIGGIFGDTGITTMDLSKWNTYGFTDVHGVFTDCAALTEVRVNNWDTSMVTTFAATFRNCTGLTEVDLSGWDTSKGANLAQMFMGCENLKTILVSERFVTPNATLVENMFTGCASLVGGAGTKYNAERTDNAYARIDSPDAPGYFTLAGAETPEAYVVSFNANGGGGSMDSVTVIKGGSFTLPQNGFSAPSQKKFRIWAVGNIEYAPGSVLTVNAPVTVTAQWENASASAQGCYVATSVYGSYDCPEVWTLRRFRDNVLAKTWYGRLFIRFYYAVSPTAVRLFGDCEWFQNFFRGRLDKMVDGLQSSGFASTPYQDKDW